MEDASISTDEPKTFIRDESWNRWFSRTEYLSVNDNEWFSTQFEGLGENGIYYKKAAIANDDPPSIAMFKRNNLQISEPVKPMNPPPPSTDHHRYNPITHELVSTAAPSKNYKKRSANTN
uniref:Uncharacterized protein n=1 Tax=Spumella elongata TaxID=89044 RepID=A0A7S3HL57_9STRA|mmetsp:Transcript_57287/g.100618  ORF Transcript_57287/g.100618 Transcript_57287/m.100618 type:complete len:120 (+) Transcript_57287:120-479(+)